MQRRRQPAGGFSLRRRPASWSCLRFAKTAFVPVAASSSEYELDACLERKGCAARCDLSDRAEAVDSDYRHSGCRQRRTSESYWPRHRAGEARRRSWRIWRATVERDCGRIRVVRVGVKISVVGQVEEIT